MDKPLISVITVVYNAQLTLEATIKSVLTQKKGLFEYWVIDGGSTDGTLEIIHKYENEITGWTCEPDKGIYDAMNKGITHALGNWIYFLGADDILIPNVLDNISSYLDNASVMAYGDILFTNGKIVPSFFSSRTLLQNTIHHQGAFYKRTLFDDFSYNTELRILSDYELNLKVFISRLPTIKLPITIAQCQEGGASSDLPSSLKETNIVRSNYIKNRTFNLLLSKILKLYYMQKKIRKFLFA